MFKFFRKIFLSLIIGIVIFAIINLKKDDKNINVKNVIAYSKKSLLSINNILQIQSRDFFNNENDEKNTNTENGDDSSYDLDFLKNGADKNKAGEYGQQFGGDENAIITLINKERFDKGVDSLIKNGKLMESAKNKALDMQRDHYFEHISHQKIQPWFFVEEANYQYEKFGENIARDYFSANSVHKAFMDSSGHKKNLLDKEFKDIGVAIVPIETHEGIEYVIVEHLGKNLKNIDISKREKYSDKSKHYCEIQKEKKKELKKMIKNQKKVIEEFEKEINKKATEEESTRMKSLLKIKEKINGYLEDCKTLKEKYKE